MAETILSPGVLSRENDISQIRSLPVVAGAAIIGPTVKGKPNIPRLVTSFSEFEAEFGTTFISGSNITLPGGAGFTSGEEFSFLTSISANIYFAQGYSGHGVALTALAGKMIAEDILKTTNRFKVFSSIKHMTFPGGIFRTPVLALGMSWYKFRDWLQV